MTPTNAALKNAETVTEHGDGDDGDDALEDKTLPKENGPSCTWSEDPDEHRRAYVLNLMADSNIDGYILTSNMDCVYQWLKTGKMPPRTTKK